MILRLILLWLGVWLVPAAVHAATYNAIANRDTHLRQDTASTNYGTATTLNVRVASNDNRRVLIGFTLPTIPSNEAITAATIRLYVTAQSNDVISLHRVNTTWTEAGATWNTAPAIHTAETSTAVNNSGVHVTFSVTALVNGWRNGTNLNHGVMLIGDAGANTTFASRTSTTSTQRPELIITTARIQPAFMLVKSAALLSDPYNLTTNPKAIPGASVRYTITLSNSSAGTADSGTTAVTEAVPDGMKLRVADYGVAGSGPVAFTNGSPSSGLTYSFAGLGNTADSIAFSNNNGATYTYTPVADGDGCDTAVTHFRVTPAGAFAGRTGAANPSFTLQLRMQVE